MPGRFGRVLGTGNGRRQDRPKRRKANQGGVDQAGGRFRYAVDFSIEGDIRFLSHNDLMRMFGRACARAALPVSFTAGFNPRMRLSLPFPRPVGQASQVERLVVELAAQTPPAELQERLQSQMPAGIRLWQASPVTAREGCRPAWVRYCVDASPFDREEIRRAAALLLASDSFPITRLRHKDGRSRVVDIRPFVDTIEVLDDAVLVAIHALPDGSVTPAEVCQALGSKADVVNHLIRRVDIRWQ